MFRDQMSGVQMTDVRDQVSEKVSISSGLGMTLDIHLVFPSFLPERRFN
jgi:hypothetical protein